MSDPNAPAAVPTPAAVPVVADGAQAVTPAPAAPKPAPIPLVLPPSSFTNPADAFKVFTLSVPVTVDGRDHKVIGIRRFTVAQMRAITDNYRENLARDPDFRPSMPLYVDEQGSELPPAVLDVIIPDDADALDKAAMDFLPARMRPTAPEMTSDASLPASGNPTGQ